MADTTIVFVHGLGGSPEATWGQFPKLIEGDPELGGFDTVSFGYPTWLFRLPFSKAYPKIQTLADALRTLLNARYGDRQKFILVCHSLGGLIGRRYLVDEVKRNNALRVEGLMLYAVPNDGAGLAAVASHISWKHNQLTQLCRDSDLIRDLDSDWENLGMAKRVKVRYIVGGLDGVVNEKSARSSWGATNVDVVSDRGHINLVKPTGVDDLPYLLLKKFARSLTRVALPGPADLIPQYATKSCTQRPASTTSKNGYRVVAFDLDGTLLRGIDFSWSVVWKYLKSPEAVRKAGMRGYLKGELSYKEWCDLACAHFRDMGLKRGHFPDIVKEITVTKNLDETLKILRASGFITALISGGIDTFIEEKIPNAAEMFDYICINRFRYEQPSGLMAGVDATPFDFAGKTAALEAICKRHGCTMKQAVFVGEGFNDEDVVKKAGLSIAYPPGETAIEAASLSIKEDDLSRILEYVL